MAVPLGDGYFGFARALTSPTAEFYDFRSETIPPGADIITKPVAFRIWVMRYAFTGRRWKKIGDFPLRPGEGGKRWWFFKQADDGTLYRTRNGYEEVPASWEEVSGLECAAAWDPEHVEDRLRDHFAGKPNKWVESLKPRRLTS